MLYVPQGFKLLTGLGLCTTVTGNSLLSTVLRTSSPPGRTCARLNPGRHRLTHLHDPISPTLLTVPRIMLLAHKMLSLTSVFEIIASTDGKSPDDADKRF